jgi:hypothetical protein
LPSGKDGQRSGSWGSWQTTSSVRVEEISCTRCARDRSSYTPAQPSTGLLEPGGPPATGSGTAQEMGISAQVPSGSSIK